MGPRQKTNRKLGPPTKKNEGVIKRLIAAARLGLPYNIVSARAGITRETLAQWRSKDAELDRQLEEARAEAAEEAWKKIMKHGESDSPNAWQSIAWRLERSHPESFSRPEIQLGVQVNQTTNNTIVITAEAAEKFAKRNAAINKELDEIGKAYESRLGKGGGATGMLREVEAENSSLVAGPISLPPGSPSASWWKSLCGDGEREISFEAAQYIVKTVATDALGAGRASQVKVDLDESTLALRDVWAAVQGFGGWEALVKRGEVERGSKHPQEAPPG